MKMKQAKSLKIQATAITSPHQKQLMEKANKRNQLSSGKLHSLIQMPGLVKGPTQSVTSAKELSPSLDPNVKKIDLSKSISPTKQQKFKVTSSQQTQSLQTANSPANTKDTVISRFIASKLPFRQSNVSKKEARRIINQNNKALHTSVESRVTENKPEFNIIGVRSSIQSVDSKVVSQSNSKERQITVSQRCTDSLTQINLEPITLEEAVAIQDQEEEIVIESPKKVYIQMG